MIDLEQAISLVETTAAPLPPRRVPLLEACGRRLAVAIVADSDSPPWDRAMMDGFAVRGADFPAGQARIELDVADEIAAGDVTACELGRGSCARIMTGAPLPPGADSVVPIEAAVEGTAGARAGGRVRLQDSGFRAGQHVARRGSAFRREQEVLASGVVLGAAEIGLAAEAGATHVVAAARPRVAILSTGSELVPSEATPAFGQTRNSNGAMLAAAVQLLGAEAIPMGIAPDRAEAIRSAVAQGLAADILMLSGGVSAGDYDLVPHAFGRCGVDEVFHKVRLKPGKPVWFGVLRRREAAPTLVFGLPGNPASSLVCFELFVRPALAILAGRPREAWHLPRCRARLTGPVKSAADRPVYLPCRLRSGSGLPEAQPSPWSGSADLLGLVEAGGLIALPSGSRRYEAGEEVDVVLRTETTATGHSSDTAGHIVAGMVSAGRPRVI